ncbi:hypothetical protein GCD22_01887 [Acidithiobacillus thiooxidans ATCC 19377]|uniref:Uncharacterized protein n=1 Tax=Acidithiobacillus thiooxidans ATCC 19377 TaxID=637390 RepID=A0A5P9XR27_ACITH|nr:hypothetical protein GCD22_01887 [Acidithiobacillus thiooxidans ATCC 19377]
MHLGVKGLACTPFVFCAHVRCMLLVPFFTVPAVRSVVGTSGKSQNRKDGGDMSNFHIHVDSISLFRALMNPKQ